MDPPPYTELLNFQLQVVLTKSMHGSWFDLILLKNMKRGEVDISSQVIPVPWPYSKLPGVVAGVKVAANAAGADRDSALAPLPSVCKLVEGTTASNSV